MSTLALMKPGENNESSSSPLERVGLILNQTHSAIEAVLNNVALPVGKTAADILGCVANLTAHTIVSVSRGLIRGVLSGLFRTKR